MAGQEGFEPTTSGFGDRRSSRWNYWPAFMNSSYEEVMWVLSRTFSMGKKKRSLIFIDSSYFAIKRLIILIQI